MYAQYYPGKPKYENSQQRLNWMESCLIKIINLEIKQIAIPYKIGCNLAGGNWDDYLELFTKFSHDLDIFICQI